MANHRPKPLMGAKKYDRAILNCTIGKCTESFFVSKGETPAKRYCEKHWQGRNNANSQLREFLAVWKGTRC